MSALPPKADIDHDGDNVHFVPQADIAFGRYQFAFCTAGGVHEPSVTAAFGQWARMKSEKSAVLGAG
jgi:hypothetical protein